MTTITINTYDPAGRFDMSETEAKTFFTFVENKALESDYRVEFACDLWVDEFSERFTEACFQDY